MTIAERGVTAAGWERGSTLNDDAVSEPTAPVAGPSSVMVTIAGFRSSLAGAGGVSGFAAPLRTIAGPVNGTAFRFRGGRLWR